MVRCLLPANEEAQGDVAAVHDVSRCCRCASVQTGGGSCSTAAPLAFLTLFSLFGRRYSSWRRHPFFCLHIADSAQSSSAHPLCPPPCRRASSVMSSHSALQKNVPRLWIYLPPSDVGLSHQRASLRVSPHECRSQLRQGAASCVLGEVRWESSLVVVGFFSSVSMWRVAGLVECVSALLVSGTRQ